MSLWICENLRTASTDLKFTGSYKKVQAILLITQYFCGLCFHDRGTITSACNNRTCEFSFLLQTKFASFSMKINFCCLISKIGSIVSTKLLLRSSGNAFVSGVGGLGFKSRASQIGHSVSNDSPPL